MKTEAKAVIFTDIDGTVLDAENSHRETEPMLRQLLARGVVLVFCSSKTKAEVEFFQKKLEMSGPFIAENGGAIFIPKGCFPFPIPGSKTTLEYDVVELGISYPIVRQKLARASAVAGVVTLGFGDMTAEKVAADSGLPLALAVLAKERMYDEPFLIAQGSKKKLADAVKAEGLTLTMGGQYLHVGGNTDKGKAVAILKQLFVRKFGSIVTYGVGDSQNDLSMLAEVNVPMLVRRHLGGRNASLSVWKNMLRMLR